MSDPKLNGEMIKLLSQELRRVNAEIHDVRQGNHSRNDSDIRASSAARTDELYALQEENARLVAEVDDVRRQLNNNSNGVFSTARVKDEDQDEVEGLLALLDELNEEAARNEEGYKKARESLEEKLAMKRAEHKEAKQTKSTLQTSVAETQAQLEIVGNEYEHMLQQLDTVEARLRNIQTMLPFDFRGFLRSPATAQNVAEPPVGLCATTSTLELPEALSKLCSPGGYISKVADEVTWPQHTGSTHCLVVGPSHYYNPTLKNSKGAWEASSDLKRLDTHVDFFHRQRESRTWKYMGIYHCVGKIVQPMKEYGGVIRLDMDGLIYKQTMLFKAMIPPLVTGMVKNMYECGALKVVCTAWRQVGYNQRLVERLREANLVLMGEQPSLNEGMPTVVPVPKEGSVLVSTKHRREEEADPGPSHKKRKDT